MFTVLFWKKAWTWIKHHWYIPVILILVLACILTGKGIKNKYFDIMMQSRENYKKVLRLFLNTKYLWGGKSADGIDCSALIQIFFRYTIY